ncbi:hypothetical protein L3X38_012089 [Prunus dulcis]|uniref:Inositol oxygenase n=1 Tax=Prunus dulcis TaxID=3755 RepID=A0AAD4ZEW4_PRUDU|nr:hypothetical protein L3X38_012089 [Prunus dulcis]
MNKEDQKNLKWLKIINKYDLYSKSKVRVDVEKTVAGSTIVNPAYTTSVQQDQLILSWINSSLTPSVLSTVSRNQTSRTTWQALEHRYASTFQNKILHLRNELLRTMKGDLSVSDYPDSMNVIHDNLALSGKLVDDDELVQIIMNNLGLAYEMIVSVVKASDTPITCDTLEDLLLIDEGQLTEQTVPLPENGPMAFVAAPGHGSARGQGRGAAWPTRGGFPNQRGGVSSGYSLNHQGYKCLDLSTRRIYVSRHVLFDEDSFPFKDLTSSKGGSFSSSNYNPDALFVFHESTNESHMVTRSQLGVRKPNPKYALNATIDVTYHEPICYSQAVKHEKWRQAMS